MRRLLPLLALLALPVHAETLFAPNTTGCQIIGPIMVPDAANTQIAMTPTAATILDHDDADLEIEVMGNAYTAVQTFTVAGTDQLIDVTTTGTCVGPTSTQIGVDALASGQIMLHVPDAVTNVSGNTSLMFYITDGNTNITDWWFNVSQIADETDTVTAQVWSEATRTLTSAANITSTGGTTVPQTGDSFARLGAPAGSSVSDDVAGVQTDTTAILADSNELQADWANGGRLDLILDARASQTSVDGLNDLSASEVNTQVDTALADIHLDHLLSADYDPASPPGTATALFNEIIESDGGVSRFTANALEEAPTGSAGITVEDIWSHMCEPENSPTIRCDDALAYVLSDAVGEGESPSDGSTWDVDTPDGNTNRIDKTYGADNGDRTISLTAPSR